MYKINKGENKISRLEEKSFKELGFTERAHLQEWLADNPTALGEEMLIIQKEFSGFNETNERLDLLALDKQGSLVIIENKLDDSGKDVTWQSLKYASYSSSLTKYQIRDVYQDYLNKYENGDNAEDKLSDFFDGKDFEELSLNVGTTQRIMMVSGRFRKEVTSTVLWLMSYNIRIQCFKVTPFAMNDDLFLNIEQILPVKDAEDFSISMANKVQDEIAAQESLKNRHHVRLAFWKEFLKEINTSNNLFSNISPSKDNWCGIGIGLSGVNLNVVATKKSCRAEIYINRGNKDENKEFFDFLEKMKPEIESTFEDNLIWERMSDKVSCRIKAQLDNVDIFEPNDWEQMISFLTDAAQRMNKAFKNPIKKLSNYAKNKS
ncbi:DUF4268 domain-containing protein [Aestuariibaculum sp. M13]|uniref:DUF4268 domain-containing protein n=1 Tax=Aestuariibaculum sp. M13 TaxID=2967132 RepID=UPI002159C9D0|nr:DUF4268 domain-containing protein [Aestuariibaculum sp. M13]MCR8667948.1 DUF4268 domain-containing protein [Aestuariibaculum sp. M13]